MTYFTIFHWISTIVIAALFFGLFLLTVAKLKGQFRLVGILVILIVAPTVEFMAVISLDKKTKIATLERFENKRVLRTEEIVFTGYVVNRGEYTIGTSTLEIKLINHGHATGRVSGTSFYRPNSFWETFFGSDSAKEKNKERPGTLLKSIVVAKDLPAGERRKFKVRFKYPSYFRDVAILTKLSNH